MQLMLAGKCTDVDKLRYPILASPKLDGIRATVIDGVLMSRNMKPIPNAHAQKLFGKKKYNRLDGELIVGDPTDSAAFRSTGSVVMSDEHSRKDINFWVFDKLPIKKEIIFDARFAAARALIDTTHIHMVPHTRMLSSGNVMTYEEICLASGYEGVMLRDPNGLYKFGRSTEREGALLKLKRFEDSEAEIIGVEELMHNDNAATRDELGRTKRTSHKAGKRGGNRVGALLVRDVRTGVEFGIGSGMSTAIRAELWAWHAEQPLNGLVVKYRFFPSGSKDKPRFPVFLGFRDERDM